MKSTLRFALLGLSMGLVVSACTPSHRYVDGMTSEEAAVYALDTGDRLRVQVFGQDNLSNLYTVDPSGKITMPLIGSVQARGLSTSSLAADIVQRLKAGYIREPHVTIDVDTYRPFYILGEVTSSGQFQYVSGMTVETAVAIAGGYTPRAERSRAEVTRKLPDGRMVSGSVPLSYRVQPGDTIKISERWF
jgi:polysaccharide export outer membrane protein